MALNQQIAEEFISKRISYDTKAGGNAVDDGKEEIGPWAFAPPNLRCYIDEDASLLRYSAAMADLDNTVISQLTMTRSKPMAVIIPSRDEDTYSKNWESKSLLESARSEMHGRHVSYGN
jgi:hypothetical protein